MRSDLKIYFPQLTNEEIEQLHEFILNVCLKTGDVYESVVYAIVMATKTNK